MNDERLEQDLREALMADDPGPAPESLRVRLARVPDEASPGLWRARRLSRPWVVAEAFAAVAVVAVAVVIAVGLRGAGSGPGATAGPSAVASPALSPSSVAPSSLPGVVPWVDRRAPSPTASLPAAPPSTPLPVADARPCRPSDLRVAALPMGAAAGNMNLPVSFANISSSACALVGYPGLAGVTAAGAVEPITVTQGSYFGDPGLPANLAPGSPEVAEVYISGGSACDAAQAGGHRVYPVLRIGLPAGGTVDVPGSSLDAVCGVSVSTFGVPAPTPSEPAPPPLDARISAPSDVVPGTTLTYVVTITNGTDAPVALDPCPAYEEFLGSGSSPWVLTVFDGYLNCDAVHAIPAHGAVSFEMRLDVPANQPAGQAKFGWSLVGGGPSSGAPMVVRPGP